MAGLHRTPVYPHEERIARVVWAYHILSYLTKNQSHEELHEAESAAEDDSDTDEPSDCETDYETEKTVILSGPRDSVRQKFLDCIAQLLSPCKGWDGVTATAIREGEDGVEVDVARNDGFLYDGDCFDGEIIGYCKMLEKFLASSGAAETGPNLTATSPTEFENKVIDYTSRRTDYWIEDLQKTLKLDRSCPDWNSPRWLRQGAAVETWTTMADLILQFDAKKAAKTRARIVQQAYICVSLMQLRQLLPSTFGTQAGLKIWNKLNFIARPLLDFRLLGSIAAREPHFRDCKISLIPPKSKTTLDSKYVVGVFQAWERLGLGHTPKPVVRKLNPFNEEFKKACAETFSLHAEMQLVLHYEEGCVSQPSLDYFGCSKKTCLLCETFLRALPSPIATRGRHGVCYPAWGVPDSSSDTVDVAVEILHKSLVTRIEGFLNDFMRPGKKSPAANVMQSDMVSDFSHLTLDEWQRREQDVQMFKNKQTDHRNNLMNIEGITPNTKPRHHPRENFEPEDCCVMCNKSPGLQCGRCRSTHYCSKDCQKSDYPSHKLLCHQFTTQGDRPSPEHKRAIFFPVDRERPCLIWIPCRREIDKEDGVSWIQIDPFPYLGTDKPFKGTMRIEHNPVRYRNLGSGFAAWAPFPDGYCVSLIHRDAYLKDGSTTNKSILASVRASCTSTTPHEYRGPMIAIREIHREDYEDITLADFRHLMDYLVSYRNTHIRESVPDLQHRAATAVQGVKICCHGEVKLHGSESFVSVDITRANKIALGDGSISPISVCLGMPIRLWKDPDVRSWFDPPGWVENMNADSNPDVASMMRGTDPSKDEFGLAPLYWKTDIGNVWAVREDGRDLDVTDVEMMCRFARRKLQRMFEDVLESDSSLVDRQRVLDFITWDNMVTHWNETVGEEQFCSED